MNTDSIKGYILVVLSGLVLFAAILLLVLLWGNDSNFSLYGKSLVVNTAVLVIGSAVGGVILAIMIKILIIGIRALRKGQKNIQRSKENITEPL